MAHGGGGGAVHAGVAQLVLRPECAVDQQRVAVGQFPRQLRVERGHAGHDDQSTPRLLIHEAITDAVSGVGLGASRPIARRAPRDRERLIKQAGGLAVTAEESRRRGRRLKPVDAAICLEQGVQGQALAQRSSDCGRRMDAQPTPLAEGQQAEHVIEVGAGEEDTLDGAAADRPALIGSGQQLDLGADVRGGPHEEPSPAVGADGDARLSPG